MGHIVRGSECAQLREFWRWQGIQHNEFMLKSHGSDTTWPYALAATVSLIADLGFCAYGWMCEKNYIAARITRLEFFTASMYARVADYLINSCGFPAFASLCLLLQPLRSPCSRMRPSARRLALRFTDKTTLTSTVQCMLVRNWHLYLSALLTHHLL